MIKNIFQQQQEERTVLQHQTYIHRIENSAIADLSVSVHHSAVIVLDNDQ